MILFVVCELETKVPLPERQGVPQWGNFTDGEESKIGPIMHLGSGKRGEIKLNHC